jgi:hypothetical protein
VEPRDPEAVRDEDPDPEGVQEAAIAALQAAGLPPPRSESPAVSPEAPLDEPTVLLPIPVSWIDRVCYDRDGCEAWMGFEEPLRISIETADTIVRLMREGSP